MHTTSQSSLKHFFRQMEAAFAATASAVGEETLGLELARKPVRVRFAGRSLHALKRPLQHLATLGVLGDGDHSLPPSLEILAWEGRDLSFPRPPWDFANLTHQGEIAGLEPGPVRVNFCSDGCLLSLYDDEQKRGLFWLPEAEQLPYWETAAPFRVLLHWWSESFGGHFAHAAVVGREGRGAMLVGRGGSGKSTTSLACLDAGMEYVGDDYILLTCEDQLIAHSVYQSAKAHAAFLAQAFPEWQSRVADYLGPDQKALMFIHECMPAQVRRELPIDGVFQPRIGGEVTARIEGQRSALAILGVAPSTMYQLPGARTTALAFFAQAARLAPSHLLHLAPHVMSAPAVLSTWLRQERNADAA